MSKSRIDDGSEGRNLINYALCIQYPMGKECVFGVSYMVVMRMGQDSARR